MQCLTSLCRIRIRVSKTLRPDMDYYISDSQFRTRNTEDDTSKGEGGNVVYLQW